jgi:hypothetical protein
MVSFQGLFVKTMTQWMFCEDKEVAVDAFLPATAARDGIQYSM